jgi:cytoskeletal protein CcmA (bactofilin family)
MRKRKQHRASEQINSFIGKEVQFDGKLTFTGSVKVDGHFKGEVKAASGNLFVGDEGVVEANIHVACVVCSGEIRGRVTADESVNIHVPGKVFGDIQAPTVVIEEGVRFEGSCKTTPPDVDTGQAGRHDLKFVESLPSSKKPAKSDA